MNDIYIKSIGHYVPVGRIDNRKIMDFFKKANNGRFTDEQFDTINKDIQMIFGFLGIRTRSVFEDIENENSVAIATKSCRMALEKAGIQADEIDCLIMTGISNPFREPTFANIVSRQLGLNNVDFFDVNDTCSGTIKSMEIASLYIRSGKYKNVLIGSCENNLEFAFDGPGIINEANEFFVLDNINDFRYKVSSYILGSGAGALILSANGGGCKFLKNAEFRDNETWDRSWVAFVPYLTTPPTVFGKKLKGFWTDASTISAFLMKKTPEFIKQKLAEWSMNASEIDHVITPQLGNNITYGIVNQLNIDPSKVISTFSELGNMGSANMLVNLGVAEDGKLLKKGDRILCIGSGGGLSILLALLEW